MAGRTTTGQRRRTPTRRGRPTTMKKHSAPIALLIICWQAWHAIPARHRPYILFTAAVMGTGMVLLGRDLWWQPALALAGLWLFKFGLWIGLRVRAANRMGSPRPEWFRWFDRYLVEWWRKGRVTRQWNRLCDREKWWDRKGRPIRLRLRSTPAGDIVGICDPGNVALRKDDIEGETIRLRNTIGCKEVAVRDHPNPRRVGRLVVTFFYNDPLERLLLIQDLPLAPEPVLVKNHLGEEVPYQQFVVYGVREDGKPALMDTEFSVLVGGMPGMGKSSLAWTYLDHHIREEIWTWVYAADLKGGMEMGALRRTKDRQFPSFKDAMTVPSGKSDPDGVIDNKRFQVRGYTRTVTETEEMLRGLVKMMEARQRWMDDHGLRKHLPNERAPKVIVILDEFLMLKAQCSAGATSDLGILLTQGRAAGIVCLGLAQTGHASELGVIRNFYPIRRCFAMKTATATMTVIGESESESGAYCSKLSEVRHRGICYAVSEGSRRAQRERVAFVSDVPYEDDPDNDSDLLRIARGLLPQGQRTAKDERRWTTYHFWGYPDPVTRGRPFIYVGKVDDRRRLEERMQEHRRDDASWWHLVDESTMETFDHPTRKAMLEAERTAIRELKPTHNVQGQRHNPGQRRRKLEAGRREVQERARKVTGGDTPRQSTTPPDYLNYRSTPDPVDGPQDGPQDDMDWEQREEEMQR